MKILFAMTLFFVSLSSHGAQFYTCTSENGNVAELTIRNFKSIHWNETWHSASSKGHYIGKEEASYSSFNGYYRYQLTDFLNSEDSGFFIALSEIGESAIKAVVYFDNDDHNEEEVFYNCNKQDLK